MPEEQTHPVEPHASEASNTISVSDSKGANGATSLALPLVDDGAISLRITIDFQRSPGHADGLRQAVQSLNEGGSQDTKGSGGRSYQPEPSTTG